MDVAGVGRGWAPLPALWWPPPESAIKAHLGPDRSFINDPCLSRAISCVLLWTAASEHSSFIAWDYQLLAYVLLEIREETCFPCLGTEPKASGEAKTGAQGRMPRNLKVLCYMLAAFGFLDFFPSIC